MLRRRGIDQVLSQWTGPRPEESGASARAHPGRRVHTKQGQQPACQGPGCSVPHGDSADELGVDVAKMQRNQLVWSEKEIVMYDG